MVRNALYLLLFLLLTSCKSTTESISLTPIEVPNQESIALFPENINSESWAYKIEQFYLSDTETVILPYINLVRSFDDVTDEEYCSIENNKRIALALKLNPSSLFSYIQMYSCAYKAGNEIDANNYLDSIQGIAEALLQGSTGEDPVQSIEVRELDEAYVILELSGLQTLDIEIIKNRKDFVYKFHILDMETNKFEYRYFKNSKLLKVMYGRLNGEPLTTEQVTEISFETYTQQQLPAALIPIARQQLLNNNFHDVIELLSPLPKESGLVITLLAEAHLKAGNTEEFYSFIEALEILSDSGLIEAKVLLAQFIQTHAENDDEFEEVLNILQNIDTLTYSDRGALLLGQKLSTYENSVELIRSFLERTNNPAYWDTLPSIAEYVHKLNINSHSAEYELLQLSAEKKNTQAIYELAKLFKNGHLVDRNNENAAKLYQKSAALGNANAQLDLGFYYEKGALGLEKNNDIAFEWYLKSAEQLQPVALSNLANYYEHGIVVKQNLEIALEYYNQAFSEGYNQALCNLGDLYRDHESILDIERAIDVYKMGAIKGINACQFNLGLTYEKHLKNHLKAIEWYQIAFENGNKYAAHYLGEMYRNGNGVNLNLKKAAFWYEKSVSIGSTGSMVILASMFWEGNGVSVNQEKALALLTQYANRQSYDVNRFIGEQFHFGEPFKKDYKVAIKYYELALMDENSFAANSLGNIYRQGLGTKVDYVKALELYTTAANWGSEHAMFNVGDCYFEGLGVNINKRKALHWYKKSAELGLGDAMYKIATIYHDGEGVNSSLQQSNQWLVKAVDKGVVAAKWELGNNLLIGSGIQKNESYGNQLIKESAEQGYAPAVAYMNEEK